VGVVVLLKKKIMFDSNIFDEVALDVKKHKGENL